MREPLRTIERILVRIVEGLKRIFHAKTWQIENAFILIILVSIALISNSGWIEWVGVLAVTFTWNHASVANRLEEMQSSKVKKTDAGHVHCYKWTTRYFFMKEILWFVYFIVLGAWSALAGVVIFLLYIPWRRLWRKYHPVK